MNELELFDFKDEYIYRFVPINRFSLDSIYSSGLYFGAPDSQNDPLDSYFHTNFSVGTDVLIPLNLELDKKLEEHKKEIRKTYGICSFSRIHSHILLWSHYADGAKGICLVFNRKELIKSLNDLNNKEFKIEEVRYNGLPTISLNQNNVRDFDLEKPLYHKMNEWEYEKEIRIFTKVIDEHRFFNFSPNCLVAIILGNRFERGINSRLICSIIQKHKYYSHLTVAKIFSPRGKYASIMTC